MVEMRWFVNSDFVKVLQYRQKLVMGAWGTIPPIDAPTGWSEWIDVPTVEEVK